MANDTAISGIGQVWGGKRYCCKCNSPYTCIVWRKTLLKVLLVRYSLATDTV